jgi:hypothetical protein
LALHLPGARDDDQQMNAVSAGPSRFPPAGSRTLRAGP